MISLDYSADYTIQVSELDAKAQLLGSGKAIELARGLTAWLEGSRLEIYEGGKLLFKMTVQALDRC